MSLGTRTLSCRSLCHCNALLCKAQQSNRSADLISKPFATFTTTAAASSNSTGENPLTRKTSRTGVCNVHATHADIAFAWWRASPALDVSNFFHYNHDERERDAQSLFMLAAIACHFYSLPNKRTTPAKHLFRISKFSHWKFFHILSIYCKKYFSHFPTLNSIVTWWSLYVL